MMRGGRDGRFLASSPRLGFPRLELESEIGVLGLYSALAISLNCASISHV